MKAQIADIFRFDEMEKHRHNAAGDGLEKIRKLTRNPPNVITKCDEIGFFVYSFIRVVKLVKTEITKKPACF